MIKMTETKKNPYEYLCHITRVNFYKRGLNYMSGVYYADGHPRQYMECFYKEGCTDMPVIIWIHGGAWDDEFLTASYRPEETLAKLAEAGFFIACLEYRLTRHAVLPACLEDCQMAVRFLREHAEKYHINPEKIGLWGESAGAHIACMVGSDYSGCKMQPVQCVVSFYCPSNLNTLVEDMNHEPGFVVNVLPSPKLEEEEITKILKEMSPVSYAHKQGLPPMLLFHGACDGVVSCNQSIEYAGRLRNEGNEAKLVIVPGQGHGFFSGSKYYDQVIDFFNQNLSE
jgi:acetyl esterase/lipase